MGTRPWINIRGSAIALIAAAALMSSCSVYDPSLLGSDDGSMPDGQRGDGATDDASDNDASMGDGAAADASGSGCVPSDREFCPLICPETCNAMDDDCDGLVDEMPSTLCDLADTLSECVDGQCLVIACTSSGADCDGVSSNGCEARLDSTDNCGLCGMTCSIFGAEERCVQATCIFEACLPGFGDCDGDPGSGCEQTLDTLANCGGCRVACGAVDRGQPGCIDGNCGIAVCESGFDDCDGFVGNGCETPLDTLNNCGACDTRCEFDRATSVCASGTCVVESCSVGYANCDNVTDNGCEVTLADDVNNCGACGRACNGSGSGGSFQCVAGECVVTTCPTGFADCDNDGSNGCETSVRTLTDCGACGTACNFANANGDCSTGTCTLGTCLPGFDDCDNTSSNGCEVSLATDTDCGMCDRACDVAGGRMCSGGVCSLVNCPSGLADCNNDGDDCEQSLSTLLDCGACDIQCGDAQGRLPNATASCSSGTCAVATCSANFKNCDTSAQNGCETSLLTTANCGDCGTACSRPNASVTCSTGACAIDTCNSGFANCDNNANNGCETPTNTNINCGGCNVTCAQANATTTCSSGTCQRVTCDPGSYDCDGNAQNGCEGSSADSDSDGFPNCLEDCDNDPNKQVPGVCGCGIADINSDGDGALDCLDGCPFDASTTGDCLRKRITILANTATATLTDFPVLVRFVDPALSAARPDGLDIWFSADGGPTALAFEIERFVQSAGELVAWVKLPLIAAGSDTTFYLRYGDGSGTNKSSAASVWSNGFRAVYHMNYGGGAGTQNDSTSNANHAPPDVYTGGGCAATAGQPADQPAGMIGKALTFGGNTCNRLRAPDSASLDITTELTISAWLRTTTNSGAQVVVSKRIRVNETCNYEALLGFSGNMAFMWGTGNMWPPVYASAPAAVPALNTWAYTVWTVQGSPKAMRTYLNGVRINSTDQNLSSNVGGSYPVGRQLQLNANAEALFIGGNDQETDAVFRGDLDEVRIAATSRSLPWIKAEYDNQRSGSTFLTIVED